MKILHVTKGMQRAAGTSAFCGEVCNCLVAAGHDVTLAVSDIANLAMGYPTDPRVKIVPIVSVIHGKAKYDIAHIHAIWSPILHRVVEWAQENRVPIVWSPHGMLTAWAMRNKQWKKCLGWWLYQKRDLSHANFIHATAQSEVEDVRRLGLTNKVIVAPLGVNVGCRVKRILRTDSKKVLLFVGRIQRKKGLLNLVQAWAHLDAKSKVGWVVRIVGPDEDCHTAELQHFCGKFGIAKDFEFAGPKYGDDLAMEYASANLFVLPTHSENFGSVIIEALSSGVPVVTTKGAPWQELEERRCGWWIEIGVEPLVYVLRVAMALSDDERWQMGRRGRELVEEKYTWDAVVRKMIEGYEALL